MVNLCTFVTSFTLIGTSLGLSIASDEDCVQGWVLTSIAGFLFLLACVYVVMCNGSGSGVAGAGAFGELLGMGFSVCSMILSLVAVIVVAATC